MWREKNCSSGFFFALRFLFSHTALWEIRFIHRRHFGNRLMDVHEFYGFIASYASHLLHQFIAHTDTQAPPKNLKSSNHFSKTMNDVDWFFFGCNFIKMLSLKCNTLYLWQLKVSFRAQSLKAAYCPLRWYSCEI